MQIKFTFITIPPFKDQWTANGGWEPKWRHCQTREKETLNLASSKSRVPRKGLTFKLFRNFWTIVFVDFPSFPCRSALRNWLFQVSKDGKNWTTLYTHTDDNSLNEPGYDILWLFPSRTFIYFCRLVLSSYVHYTPRQLPRVWTTPAEANFSGVGVGFGRCGETPLIKKKNGYYNTLTLLLNAKNPIFNYLKFLRSFPGEDAPWPPAVSRIPFSKIIYLPQPTHSLLPGVSKLSVLNYLATLPRDEAFQGFLIVQTFEPLGLLLRGR